MTKNLSSVFSILLLLTIFSPHSFAQSKRKIACQLAHDLKQGTLIVVLKTDAKKLAYLEKFSKQGSDREMARYAKMLRRTLAERDTTWKYTTLGFSTLYQFSAVTFLMDTSLGTFLKNPADCTFYDATLRPITHLPQGRLFVCKYGHTFGDQSTNLQNAWYVMDSHLQRLPKPFPEMVRFSVFRPAFTLRLPPDFMQQNGISKTTKHHKPLRYAMKLNADLIKYYTKKGDCE